VYQEMPVQFDAKDRPWAKKDGVLSPFEECIQVQCPTCEEARRGKHDWIDFQVPFPIIL